MVKRDEKNDIYRGEVDFARHALKEISDVEFVRGILDRAWNVGDPGTIERVEDLLENLESEHPSSPESLVEMARREVGLRDMTLPEIRYRMYYAIASEFTEGRIDLHDAEVKLYQMIDPNDMPLVPSHDAEEIRNVLALISEIDQLCDSCSRPRPSLEKELYATELEIKSNTLASILKAAAKRIRD